jgi:hypothetical protein
MAQLNDLDVAEQGRASDAFEAQSASGRLIGPNDIHNLRQRGDACRQQNTQAIDRLPLAEDILAGLQSYRPLALEDRPHGVAP